MANFGLLVLTNVGIQAQYKAQAGGRLKFKRIGMGSGKYTGNISSLTKLVTENVSVSISNGYVQNGAYTIEGFFSNEGLQTGFAWREIGVFAEDADGNEVLYCYANAGNTYDYIPATEDERYSKYLRVAMAVGNASNVSFVENEGFLYVDYQAFNEAVLDLRTTTDQLWPSKVVSGTAIAVKDSANHPFLGLTIYGKSTQDGTPTPDTPVEIVSIPQSPTVYVNGKNLVNATGEDVSWNGITYTVNDDGTVVASGTATDLSYKNFSATLPKGDYIVSGCPVGGNVNTGYFIRIVATAEGSATAITVGDDIGNGLSFSLEKRSEVTVRIVVRSGKSVSDLVFAPMIRMATFEDGTFESYRGKAMPITTTDTLKGIPVSSGGNYTDANGQQWVCDEIDLGRGMYVQRIKTFVLTGEESWSASAYYPNTVQRSRGGLASGDGYLSNMYSGKTLNENQSIYIGGAINIRDDIHAVDVETWKGWLSQLYADGTPLVVLGILETPVETALPAEQIVAYKELTTNNPNTTVTNRSGADMKVHYITKTFEDVVSAARTMKGDVNMDGNSIRGVKTLTLTEASYGTAFPESGEEGQIFILLEDGE